MLATMLAGNAWGSIMKLFTVVVVTLASGLALVGCDKNVAENSSTSVTVSTPNGAKKSTLPTPTSTGTQDKPGSASPPTGGGTSGISTGGTTPQ
jgi:hypothetical protein